MLLCSTGAPQEKFWLLSCSPSTPQTSWAAPQPVTCKSFLIILRLWSLQNYLQINAGKTKEVVVVDLCKRQHSLPAPVDIQRMDIKRVTSYKHLGVGLNNKLDWSENTDALFKKWQSRLLLPRILRSFGVLDHLWSVILERSAGQALSLPGTKRGWRDSISQNCQLCPGLLPGFSGGSGG